MFEYFNQIKVVQRQLLILLQFYDTHTKKRKIKMNFPLEYKNPLLGGKIFTTTNGAILGGLLNFLIGGVAPNSKIEFSSFHTILGSLPTMVIEDQ